MKIKKTLIRLSLVMATYTFMSMSAQAYPTNTIHLANLPNGCSINKSHCFFDHWVLCSNGICCPTLGDCPSVMKKP